MVDLTTLKIRIAGWANQMYSRFGCPVYLVGSSLYNQFARDVDLRIVLPDEQFEARYGNIEEWSDDTWRNEWREARQKWAKDMGKLSMEATITIRANIDFQVEPESLANIWHKGKDRVRIDNINTEEEISG